MSLAQTSDMTTQCYDMTTQCYRLRAYANPVRKRPEMISTWASTPSMGYAYPRPTAQIVKSRPQPIG